MTSSILSPGSRRGGTTSLNQSVSPTRATASSFEPFVGSEGRGFEHVAPVQPWSHSQSPAAHRPRPPQPPGHSAPAAYRARKPASRFSPRVTKSRRSARTPSKRAANGTGSAPVYAARGRVGLVGCVGCVRSSSPTGLAGRLAEASETKRKSSSNTAEKRSNTSVTPPDADARGSEAIAAGAMTHEQFVRGRYSPFAPLPSVTTPERAMRGRDASWPHTLGRDDGEVDASVLAVAFGEGGRDAAASTAPRIVATSMIAAEATRVMTARYSVISLAPLSVANVLSASSATRRLHEPRAVVFSEQVLTGYKLN